MFCNHCGTQLPDGCRHCHACGALQNASPATQSAAYQETTQVLRQAPTPQTAPSQPVYYTEPPADPYTPKTRKEKKPLSKKSKTVIGISIAALVLIAIGLFLWLEIFTVRVFVPSRMTRKNADGEETMKAVVTYDNKGNPKKATIYENGEKTGSAEIKYNSKGHKKANISYDANGEETGRTEYDCNSKGNVTEERHYDSDGSITRSTEYEYNSKGYCIKAVHFLYNDHGEESEGTTTEYAYDSKGNRTAALDYNSNGRLTWKEACEYDKNNNCTLRIYYSYHEDENGKESSRYEMSYNKKNKIIEQLYYSNGGEDWTRRTEYEYDKKGHLTQINRYDQNNNLVQFSKIKCDDNGNPTKETSFNVDANGEETETNTTTYTYKEFRMSKQQAKKLQEEMNNAVYIDEGWFPNS